MYSVNIHSLLQLNSGNSRFKPIYLFITLNAFVILAPMFITRQLRCFFAKSFTSLCGILKYNSTRLFKCQGHF